MDVTHRVSSRQKGFWAENPSMGTKMLQKYTEHQVESLLLPKLELTIHVLFM